MAENDQEDVADAINVPHLTLKATIAIRIQRYLDAMNTMETIVGTVGSNRPMTVEEGDLLCRCFNYVIRPLQEGFEELRELEINNDLNLRAIVTEYRASIANEISGICAKMQTLLEQNVFKSVLSNEERVQFLTLKAYCYSITSECPTSDVNIDNTMQKALRTYEEAVALAGPIDAANTRKLLLMKNYTVFLFEILKSKAKASKIVKQLINEVKRSQNYGGVLDNNGSEIYEEIKDYDKLWTRLLASQRDR